MCDKLYIMGKGVGVWVVVLKINKNHYALISQAKSCNMTFTAGNLVPSNPCIGWPNVWVVTYCGKGEYMFEQLLIMGMGGRGEWMFEKLLIMRKRMGWVNVWAVTHLGELRRNEWMFEQLLILGNWEGVSECLSSYLSQGRRWGLENVWAVTHHVGRGVSECLSSYLSRGRWWGLENVWAVMHHVGRGVSECVSSYSSCWKGSEWMCEQLRILLEGEWVNVWAVTHLGKRRRVEWIWAVILCFCLDHIEDQQVVEYVIQVKLNYLSLLFSYQTCSVTHCGLVCQCIYRQWPHEIMINVSFHIYGVITV